jgi:protocatechuate 3,4-dioxygenase beta subunit
MNSNTNCSVVAGAAVYIWHCTGNGLYSLYDTAVQSQNYLRGVQVSDANGQVTFTTIFPGCYSGRYPHIHVEVFRNIGLATQLSNSSLVSQLALPRTECAAVYAAGGATYGNSTSNLNAIQISTDNVFSDNGTSVITAQTPTLTGSATTSYTGAVTIGVPLS